jgi:hypothetical protein
LFNENNDFITSDYVVQRDPKLAILEDINLKEIQNIYYKLTNETFCFFRFIKSYKLIKEICNSKNIPLYWYSWSNNITLLGNDIKDKFFDGYRFINEEELNNLNKKSLARDYQHMGKEYTKRLAESFFEKHTRIL